jgi:hypothetical protein
VVSLRNSPNSGCTTFSCPMRKIERRSGLLQVGGEVFVRLEGQVRQPRKRFSWIFAMFDWLKLPPGSQPQDQGKARPSFNSRLSQPSLSQAFPKPFPSLLSSLFSSHLANILSTGLATEYVYRYKLFSASGTKSPPDLPICGTMTDRATPTSDQMHTSKENTFPTALRGMPCRASPTRPHFPCTSN